VAAVGGGGGGGAAATDLLLLLISGSVTSFNILVLAYSMRMEPRSELSKYLPCNCCMACAALGASLNSINATGCCCCCGWPMLPLLLLWLPLTNAVLQLVVVAVAAAAVAVRKVEVGVGEVRVEDKVGGIEVVILCIPFVCIRRRQKPGILCIYILITYFCDIRYIRYIYIGVYK